MTYDSSPIHEIEDFAEGQWWLQELDAMVKDGTPDQKRAVAVVRNLMRHYSAVKDVPSTSTCGWKEAAIAWTVCASIHNQWAKGKDALFTTRQADFNKHADDARTMALKGD